MKKKSFVFALAVALVLSFASGAKAGVMDEEGGSMMMNSAYVSEGNKEFVLKSGYYYQKASLEGGGDRTEHGFLIGFALSRILSTHELFGVEFRSSLRVEPDIRFGFADEADNTLNHLLVPTFLQADFSLTSPMEFSLGVGTGFMVYDIGDHLDRQTYMPVIGKIGFDYVKTSGLKLGVEGRGHYVINKPQGPVRRLWGASGIAKISILF